MRTLALAVIGAEVVLAATFAASGLIGLSGHAQAATEDSPSWSCVDDGNRICGPGNANGVPAGCYDDGGVLVAPWPCHVIVNPDGSADIYQ